MILFPNAKINLGLDVVEKRKDGYHNIESVFVGVDWCDILEFIPSNSFSFESNGIIIESDTNLVTQAYDLLKIKFDLPPIKVQLEKIIPIGAGLGGGSADASFMLKGLNDYFDLNISQKELENYAAQLGSDCPFFIANQLAKVTGKGEFIEPINSVDLSKYKVVLINPNIHISTQEAYRGIISRKPTHSISEIINQPIARWEELGLKNDFEFSIFKKHPEIKAIKDSLYAQGAIYTSMSGSGSTVFGIFDTEITDLKTVNNHQVFIGNFI